MFVISSDQDVVMVLSEPSEFGQVVERVHPGEEYVFIAKVSDWYKFHVSDDLDAWIEASDVTTY